MRSASNTGFVPSSSTQSNSSRVCISPEVLDHRTPAVMKGCTDRGLPTSTEAQQLVEARNLCVVIFHKMLQYA